MDTAGQVTSASRGTLPTNVAEATSDGANRLISSDFETFLRMLTAQLENQDPLNPLESTDFAVQLATFSGVEQQVRTNDLLGELTTRMNLSGLSDLAGWIGREARAPAAAVFSGEPITLDVAPEAGAAQAELVVTDAAGSVVDRSPIAATNGQVTWSGQTAMGVARPAGAYAFRVVSYDNEGSVLGESVPETFVPVTEVRMQDGNTVLVLASGATVRATEVTGVRSATG